MAASEDVVKTIQPKKGQLCTACLTLIPGEYTVQLESKDWGTLSSVGTSAQSCSLCSIILSGRQNWLDDCEERGNLDEKDIDDRSLSLTLTRSQLCESGVSSNTVIIFLPIGVFSVPQFFFIMSCESEARCAALPIWRSFPTTINEKLDRLRTWLRECESSHRNCRPRTSNPPTRLVKVGSQNGDEPRLVYSKDLTERHPEYATLSYCWGDILPIRALKETEAEFRKQIPYRSLPRTFQEAIAIARVLQIPFIWIDALCIIQDDPSDWEKEATRMQQIYSGSTLTIAASGAKDTSEGFFAHELPRFRSAAAAVERAQFSFDNAVTGKLMNVQVQHHGALHTGMSPILQTRGWTLQESVLSNRIVQCVQSELYWRCNQGCQNESGVLLPPTTNLSWNTPVIDLKDDSGSHKLWWKLIEDYTGRSFTFHKDRLPAIAGLISYFQKNTKMSPCLGLWDKTLHQDLAWMRIARLDNEETSSNAELNFPSWTWLSCPVAIIFEPAAANAPLELREIPLTVTSHAKVVDWHVAWEGYSFTSNLKSTRLILEGPIQELFIEITAESKAFKPPYCIINNNIPKDSTLPIPWRSTVQFDNEEWRPAAKWTCLLLQSTIYADDQKKRRDDTFLLIEPLSSDSEVETYRRVGIGISRDDDSAFGLTVRRAFRMV